VRILFLNDNRDHPNWGAQATPHSMDALFESELPGWQRAWLSWDWLRTRHRRLRSPLSRSTYDPAGVRSRTARLVLVRLSRTTKFFPGVADDFDLFADEWMAGGGGPMARRFLHELELSDVLVYNGENSLYRNTTEGMRALFLLWLSKTRVGKPTCIVNHTAHLTGVRPIMNAMVRKVHPVLDLVTCRESASHRHLHELGITNAELVPDIVFWLSEEPRATRHVEQWLASEGLEPQRYICMSASGLPVSRPRGERDGEVTALVRQVQENTGLRAVLLARDAHCQFLEEVARRTGAAYFGSENHFTDLWPLTRHAAVTISGHFHYVIIASIGGCPFVPLSANNHKMAGVCEMLQWEPAEPFDVTDLASCGGAITSTVQSMLEARADLSAHLRTRVAELRERLATLPTMVRQTAERAV